MNSKTNQSKTKILTKRRKALDVSHLDLDTENYSYRFLNKQKYDESGYQDPKGRGYELVTNIKFKNEIFEDFQDSKTNQAKNKSRTYQVGTAILAKIPKHVHAELAAEKKDMDKGWYNQIRRPSDVEEVEITGSNK